MNGFEWAQMYPMIPEAFLALSAMVLLVSGTFPAVVRSGLIPVLGILAAFTSCIFILGMDWGLAGGGGETTFFVLDSFAAIVKLMLLVGVMASLAISTGYLRLENLREPEYTALILLAAAGMMIMVSASNLLILYMGIELQALSLYILAAFYRDSPRSAEAGIKYFVLGALSSGLLLYGCSLIYGVSGTLDFAGIGTYTDQNPGDLLLLTGLVFLIAGLAFKISVVPFHMWTPDVYDGAPTPVTAYFSIVPKLAAIALLARVLFDPFAAVEDQWRPILWFLSASSMILASFAALRQDNLKRLLAYSSIGNMGYALLGITAGSVTGLGTALFYVLIYMVMTAGTFGCVLALRRDEREITDIPDLAGLSRTNPYMAWALALLMFSLAGIPPLAGFFGKLLVFQAAIAEGMIVLAVIGVLTSVVAAYYYLRVIKVMFFDAPKDPLDPSPEFARRAVVLVSVLFVLFFLIKPAPVLEMTDMASDTFFYEAANDG